MTDRPYGTLPTCAGPADCDEMNSKFTDIANAGGMLLGRRSTGILITGMRLATSVTTTGSGTTAVNPTGWPTDQRRINLGDASAAEGRRVSFLE